MNRAEELKFSHGSWITFRYLLDNATQPVINAAEELKFSHFSKFYSL